MIYNIVSHLHAKEGFISFKKRNCPTTRYIKTEEKRS